MFQIVRPTIKKISPMGMLKSGTQSPEITSESWGELTSFITDPAYPSTIMSGTNKLFSNGTGSVNVTASVHWTSQAGTYDRNIRVKIDGTIVWTKGVQSLTAGSVQSGTFNISLAAGQIISLEAWTSSIQTRAGIQGTSNTFLRWDY
jgi:hypothetical protein